MKKHLSLLFILIAALGGLAVYALQGDDDSWDPSIVDKMSADDSKSGGAAKSLTGAAAAREVLEASNKEVQLSIQGRVVDKAGAPVANAEVSLAARADFRSLFSNPERGGRGENPTERTDRGGRRRGGNRNGDGEDQGGRAGRGARGGRTRGDRGGSGRDRGAAAEGGESSRDRRSRGASFREALRPQKMAGSVRTDSDGGFALTGYAPTGGSLEIQVDHPSFVHKSARARIEKDKTDVKVKDIVLQRAANVAGIVVDETGRAIANATVQLRSSRRSRSRDGNESSSIADLAERFRRGGRGGEQGGSQGEGQSGQGGESGRGGRRSRGNRGGGGFDRSNLESMLEGFGGGRGRTERIAAVATDEDGKFAIFRVPAGGFTADAKADKHLPGKSDRFDLIEGDNRNDVRIQLGIGVELVGVVLNKSGESIVGALVEAAWTPQEKVDEAAKTGEASPAANANSNSNEGGRRSRRGRGGSRGGFGGRGGLTGGLGGIGNRGAASRIEEVTKTDKDGKFVLDSLPRGEFKLEIKHEDYVEWEDRKFSVAKSPSIEVRMDGRLFLIGVVVDKSTGEPIENYGIVARSVRDRTEALSRIRSMFGGGTENAPGGENQAGGSTRESGRGRRGGREQDPARQAEEATRRAEREKVRTAEKAYMVSRLGPTGKAPGRIPKPTEHPKGQFKLDKLVPGTYIIDVQGEGYVKMAIVQVKLETGKEHEQLTLELPRGGLIEGQVVHKQTREPIRRAKVELILPSLTPSTAGNTASNTDRGGRGGRGGRGSRFGRGDRGSRDRVVDEARTDKEGKFSFDRQLAGMFEVRVSISDFPDQEVTAVNVQADQDIKDLVIDARPGARVFGSVVDLEKNERATVTFTHTDGSKEEARFDRRKVEYEIKGLKDGAYYVMVDKGSGRSDRGGRGGRGGFGDRGGSRGGQSAEQIGQPDIVVRDGDDVRFNASVADLDYGSVKGYITLNNKPAKGASVRLQAKSKPATEEATPADQGGRRSRRGSRDRGQSFSGRVDDQGQFTIEKVPPGDYLLSITASRGGSDGGRGGRGGSRGGSSSIHKETIRVDVGRMTETRVSVATGRLLMTLTSPEGVESAPRTTVLLALASEAAEKDPQKWRELPSYSRQRPRSGKIDVANFKIGTYAYAISGREIKTIKGQLTVAAGNETPVVVQLEKGEGEDLGGRGGMGQFFDRMDKNKDGKLSADELGERFSQRMKDLDKNGDGVLDKAELEAMTRGFGRGGQQGGQQGGTRGGGNRGGGGGSGRGGSSGQGGGRRR